MGAAEAMTTASRPGLCPWGHQGACVSRGPGWGESRARQCPPRQVPGLGSGVLAGGVGLRGQAWTPLMPACNVHPLCSWETPLWVQEAPVANSEPSDTCGPGEGTV